MATYYPAVIERASSGYGVFFPDLPGCTSAGDNLQDAARNAEEALQGHLDIMREHNEQIPAPSNLDTMEVDDDIDEAARMLVRADVSPPEIHLDVALTKDLAAELARRAELLGFTPSGLVVQAVRELIRQDQGLGA